MPTPRLRSRDKAPRTPQPSAFRSCLSCGSSNSIRRTNCTACGVNLKKIKRRGVGQRRSSSVMATEDGQEQPMDTSVEMDPQEMATTAEEGSTASSPRSHDPHLSHQSPPPHTPSTPSEEHSTSTLAETNTSIQTESISQNIAESQQNGNSPSRIDSSTSPRYNAPAQESQPPLGSQESQLTSSPPLQESQDAATRHTSPPPPPDFFTALGMKPNSSHHTSTSARTASLSEDSTSGAVGEGEGRASDEKDMDTDSKGDGGNDTLSLMERYNKDPNDVLDLLKSALSMDKLSQLLNTEQTSNTEQLEQFQGKLDSAYQVLKDCAEHKASLTKSIEETSEKIKGKRKHLESLRDDLRVLGEEEMALKKRRDSAHSKCAQLKQKLKASKDALQQISALEKNDSVQTKDTS